MTLRLMAVEDQGPRMRTLAAICRATTSRSGGQFAALAKEDQKETALEAIESLDPVTLASVDGVFVDFDLQTDKVPGHASWAPVRLASGAQFAPRTGMAVLLLLRELMETSEYRSARQAHLHTLDSDERGWLDASGNTRLFSFVEAKDPVSRLFAASSTLWFGATYFNAQPDLQSVEEREQAVTQLRTGDRIAGEYETEVPQVFDTMMTTEFRGRNQNMVPDPHPWPTNYDLFSIYLAHSGKSGFGRWEDPIGFREAVYAVTGMQLAARRINHDSAAPIFTAMQAALEEFHGATDVNMTEWPDWDEKYSRRDLMLEYLQASRLFWTSADVRVAFEEHLRRTGQSR